jgi:glycerol-1-phosphate dehydrogenase [NAD(P)+]
MKMYDTPQSVEKYLNVQLECDCGMVHYAPIKAVVVKRDALSELTTYMNRFGYQHPYIVCDSITYEIAGQKCKAILNSAGIESCVHILENLNYDEATLGEIVVNKPDMCDVMIACGTGAITCMLRLVSFKLGLPCFTVATAAPMDGFSASVGIINLKGIKTTLPAECSEVIFADTDMLNKAPFRMTLAGFSDLISKLNAMTDWRLDVLVNGAHYCKKIDDLVCTYVDDILKKVDRIKARDEKALGELMDALMLTGATISLYGSSRPISGAEHHMSHYWEMLGERRGNLIAMHGEQVGVSTVLMLMFTKELTKTEIDFVKARAIVKKFDRLEWEADLRNVFGDAAETIISDEIKNGFISEDARLKRISVIEKNWDKIREMLEDMYPPETLFNMLKDMGSPAAPADIGLDAATLKDTFLHCKETRPRYTTLRLAWDLGLLDELSDRVISRVQCFPGV